MTFGIVEVVLLLALVLAIGIAIYAHTNSGKSEISSLHAKLDGLLTGLKLAPATVPDLPAPEAVAAPVVAPIALSDGIVGSSGLKIFWKDYAGQLDTQAFPAIIMRIGRALTDAEEKAAYAAGIRVNQASQDASEIDYSHSHDGDDLGTGLGYVAQRAVTPGQNVVLKFELDGKPHKIAIIGAPGQFFRSATYSISGPGITPGGVTASGTVPASPGYGAIIPTPFPPGAYTITFSVDGTGTVAAQLLNGA